MSFKITDRHDGPLSLCLAFLPAIDLRVTSRVNKIFALAGIYSMTYLFAQRRLIDPSRFVLLLLNMLHSDPKRFGFISTRSVSLMTRVWNMFGYPLRTPVYIFSEASSKRMIQANWKKVGREIIQQTFDWAVYDQKGHSHWNLMKLLLLLDDERLDPRFNKDYSYTSPIVYASHAGRLDIVELLLQYKHVDVDPSVQNNRAIQVAAAKGCGRVIKRLLKDPRVNPSANDNYPLMVSFGNKHFETVKVLLQNPRVNQAGRNMVTRKALDTGRYEMLEWLSLPPNPSKLDLRAQLLSLFQKESHLLQDTRQFLV